MIIGDFYDWYSQENVSLLSIIITIALTFQCINFACDAVIRFSDCVHTSDTFYTNLAKKKRKNTKISKLIAKLRSGEHSIRKNEMK